MACFFCLVFSLRYNEYSCEVTVRKSILIFFDTKMKTIIFDFDGVIHDTFDLAHKVKNEATGKDSSKEEYRDFFNGNIFEAVAVDNEIEKNFLRLQKEAFKYLKLEKDIKQHLENLSKNYFLCIISSNQEDVLNMYFQNNDFVHIFKEILGAETHRSKVEKFKYLFAKHALKVEDCVFVTDTLGDILEGHKVGVKTIAVDFGFHESERLKKGKPFKIVSNFEEISLAINNLWK